MVLAVLWFGLATPAAAQQCEQGPRIGLALSGGGALGAGHVGVLEVLEELRVPVHRVAGTSMGAIVGGLYVSGMSPEEMKQTLATMDWRRMLDDRPPRRELPYRRKQDDLTYMTRFELGFNGGSFQLPPGLVTGQNFGFKLQSMTMPVAGIRDFDELPIPFRAVATDIESGDMVVLDHGDLARAMRASMSVPGVFSPVDWEGRLLVDGGLVRNLPVDVVRHMGADVVIAVDVGTPLLSKAQLRSLAKISSQMVNLQLRRNVEQQYPQADILIKVDLREFRSTDFERSLEMVPQGEAAARQLIDALRQYAMSEPCYQEWRAALRNQELEPATLESVQLAVGSTADSEMVLRRVKTRPGDPLDVAAIRRDLQALYELGDYERVDFFLTRAGEHAFDLHIEAHEKSWGPNYLRFGTNLWSDLEGESSFRLLASYTMTGLNSRRGELKVEAAIGETPAFAGEFYQPLSLKGPWFAAAWLIQTTATVDSFVADDVFAEYRVDRLSGGFDLGLSLGKYGEVRAGITRGAARAEQRKGPDLVPEVDVNWGGYRLVAVLDQVDDPNFPRMGFMGDLGVFAARDSLGADDEYEKAQLGWVVAGSAGDHTVVFHGELDSALGSDLPVYDQFNLGGLFHLSGLPFDSVGGRYGGVAGLVYYNRFLPLPSTIGDGLYAGISLEAGNLWHERGSASFSDLRHSGALFVGADTIFGPAYLGFGYADSGETAWYLFIGRFF